METVFLPFPAAGSHLHSLAPDSSYLREQRSLAEPFSPYISPTRALLLLPPLSKTPVIIVGTPGYSRRPDCITGLLISNLIPSTTLVSFGQVIYLWVLWIETWTSLVGGIFLPIVTGEWTSEKLRDRRNRRVGCPSECPALGGQKTEAASFQNGHCRESGSSAAHLPLHPSELQLPSLRHEDNNDTYFTGRL